MNKLFPKGHRLKKRDRRIPLRLYALVGGISFGLILLYALVAVPVFLLTGGASVALYLLYGKVKIALVGGISFGLILFGFLLSYWLYRILLKKSFFFIRKYRHFLLWRFMYQNNFYFTKERNGNNRQGKPKIYFPKVYLKQEKYELRANFQLEGIKFQEQFRKTVFLRSLLTGLLRIGVVEILDPKQSDFVKLENLNVLKGRVTYTTEEMGQRLIDLKEEMEQRYEIMRQRSEEQNEEELGAFYKYDMKPLFILIDEEPSLVSALEDLPYSGAIDSMKVMSALKQIVLKGRQAGVYVVISTQNVKADDLPSTLKDNMMTRITLGRLAQFSYDTLFGEENKQKHFKYVEKDGYTGQKIFGRGYYGIFGGSAREFYAPLLPDAETYSFYMDFKSLPRIEKETSSSKRVEERFTLEEMANALNSDVRLLKKIKSKLIENSYEFASKDYFLKDKGLFEEILKVKVSSSDTLDNIINEVVSRH